MLEQSILQNYLDILREELVPATGCTEPIAIAYCAATLRELLGALPERVDAAVSGNILKNVKSVVVPNTGGRKGIGPAIAVGLVAGDAARDLQVISAVTEKQLAELDAYLQRVEITVSCSHSPCQLDIDLRGSCGSHTARVRITNHHTNIVCLERDGEVLRELPVVDSAEEHRADKSLLNVADILRFAAEVPLEDLLPLLEPQVSCNSAIAEEGLRGTWGAQIGRILLEDYGDDIKQRAKAYAAAGSDARMSGCEMPVVILSGSGNQGITATVPILSAAKSLGIDEERTFRAVTLSNLMAIHIHADFGPLSGLCGATIAAAAAACGLVYLQGGTLEQIGFAVNNMFGNVSGMLCDGAKADCALKISTCVFAAFQCAAMALRSESVKATDGIVETDPEETIRNFVRLGNEGSSKCDDLILEMLLQK